MITIEHHFSMELVGTMWLLPLFVHSFPTSLTERIFDVLMSTKESIYMLAVPLAIFRTMQKDLMDRNDLGAILDDITHFCCHLSYDKGLSLLEDAFSLERDHVDMLRTRERKEIQPCTREKGTIQRCEYEPMNRSSIRLAMTPHTGRTSWSVHFLNTNRSIPSPPFFSTDVAPSPTVLKWKNLLEKCTGRMKQHVIHDLRKRALEEDTPQVYRHRLWDVWLAQDIQKLQVFAPISYGKLVDDAKEVSVDHALHSIDADLDRMTNVKPALRRVLRAYVMRNGKIGYCQVRLECRK